MIAALVVLVVGQLVFAAVVLTARLVAVLLVVRFRLVIDDL